MKAQLRIPATESYAYIELAVEADTAEEIISEYRRITRLVQGEFGLGEKEFNSALDTFLSGEGISEAEWVGMSPQQQEVMQIVKRSKKRIMSRLNKQNNIE